MKLKKIELTILAIFALSTACKQTADKEKKMIYPETKTESISDPYHSVKVEDPYRWLEVDTAAEVEAWVKTQNKFTQDYLSQIPYTEKINARLTELFNYEKYSAPFLEGDYIYFYKNDGLQNQSVLYRQLAGKEAEVFLDPNTLSADGTVSLSGVSFSKDGSLMLYAISRAGSDWQEIYVKNAASKENLSDVIPNAKFTSLAWRGNDGFYYCTYDDLKGSKLSAKTQNHKIYYHKLGTTNNQDVLVFGNDSDPRRYAGIEMSDDMRYMFVTAANATSGNELYIADLQTKSSVLNRIVDNFDNDYDIVTTEGEDIYVLTNLNAPNKRLVKFNLNQSKPEQWLDVIKETENVLSVSRGGNYLFAKYLKDALAYAEQYDLKGNKIRTIDLPGPGTLLGLGGKRTQDTLYYLFSSYVFPTTIYAYNPENGQSTVFKKPAIAFDTEAYESKQIFYTSKDGTKIPMTITHKKGLPLDGKNPTLLYGYGGFNISLTPSFNTSILFLLEQGGIYAVANIRGGGEYGEKWHKAGTQMQKQNVFDDFFAAAEFLIAEKYTASDYLAVSGGSNGGLLVGAVITQKPDLVKVAFPAVGVLDMLRYHKFTAGAGWATDYGTADDSPEMFRYLLNYSPYHQAMKGNNYPAVMVTTGDHDDRVVPAHSFKFAAALQANQQAADPILIRIETNAGHGAGKPTGMVIAENADKMAFMLWNMGFKQLK